MRRSASPAERLWARVEKTDTCWNWTGPLHTGYGRLQAGQGRMMAHRLAWELLVGPIPDGLFLDHLCHNKACVNPEHLRTVTQKQNMEHLSGITKANTSGHLGVSWVKRLEKWKVMVGHNNQDYYVGLFTSLEDAAAAAKAKRLELFTHNDQEREAA